MNRDEHVKNQLVAYLSGNLDEKETAHVAAHLGDCDSCARELNSIRNVWLSLGSVPDEIPDPAMNRRFRETLDAFSAISNDGTTDSRAVDQSPRGEAHGRQASSGSPTVKVGWLDWISPRHPAVQFALVMVLFLVGGVVGGMLGYRMGGGSGDPIGVVQLREEVRSVNQLLIVSLLQQASATGRLQGVSWSYKLERTDPEVTSALLQTLSHDPNVNVRLAALDAVSRNITDPEVRKGLLRSLTDNSAPMVQLAILDVVVHGNMKESTGTLAELLKKPGINEVVKTRIEAALQYLNI